MTRLEPGTVLDGIDRDGAARLIVGTPGSGKTEFALSVLMAGLAGGDGRIRPCGRRRIGQSGDS